MALYMIGDIQGCDAALGQLLDTIAFSPSRDTLYVLGDLVNRGPASDLVVRRLMSYGDAARCLLGNHDLHLLAVSHQARHAKRKDTLACILNAPDSASMLDWLAHQHMALCEHIGGKNVLMVHAGVLPQWTAAQTLQLAGEVETLLRSPQATEFFHTMYADHPAKWSESLRGMDRIRLIVNALTRLRYCTADGVMEFESKGGAEHAPAGHMPWFDVPGRSSADAVVAFGHWSTLGWLGRSDVYALDLGCVWGGQLAALRLEARTRWAPELIAVDCPAMQTPTGSFI
ncbi:MAG: symmetrical bis(5'-nucleosyl)-tetraphosphatase [Rhodoferax sp.]|nr:MAG: symmetrical bis(5'-nucleosyl)-tetraphosphatase [Rhodoferax sp.]